MNAGVGALDSLGLLVMSKTGGSLENEVRESKDFIDAAIES
jgi:hypothetical protein